MIKIILELVQKFTYANNGKLFYEQLHTTRGFLSSFPHEINIGLGQSKLDSLLIVWPIKKNNICMNFHKIICCY